MHRRPFAAQKLPPAFDRSKESLPSMLDYDEALVRVRAEIAKMPPPEEDSLVVYPEHTIERPFGWVLFWGSDMYAKTGEFRYALGGNAPFIVNRHNGTVVSTGTALPIEDYIRRYEADQP